MVTTITTRTTATHNSAPITTIANTITTTAIYMYTTYGHALLVADMSVKQQMHCDI
jgi:hypothetical protein